jgi:hypothetical protein
MDGLDGYPLTHLSIGNPASHKGAYLPIYINKRIPLAKWQWYEEPDYCRVQIDTQAGPITIHNIYSEKPTTHRTTVWNTPIPRMLQAIRAPGQHLIFGDFNLHHPLWCGIRITQLDAGAQTLLEGMIEHQLRLLLELSGHFN